ncbi:MAG: hypothetical protein ABIQ18_06195 [Umezawaea sp.]
MLPMLAGFAVFGVVFVAPMPTEQMTGVFRFFPILWFGLLAWFVVAWFGLRQLTLRSTEYAVTDQRVIVTTKPFGSRREHSAYLRDLYPPGLKEHPDGRGTITFSEPVVLAATRSRRTSSQGLALEQIPEARVVRDLIVSARGGGR